MEQQPEHEFDTIRHGTLGDLVYRNIADALIKGMLRPDARLKIRELAQSMGTSVTPVREAILRLIQDGALVMKSPRDIRVPILTEDRYMEIRRIRLELEGLAAELAAERATEADLARLDQLVAANERAMADRDSTRATEINQTFHFALAEIAGMSLLGAILRGLWMQTGPVIAAAYEGGGRTMIVHHYEILDALRRRDGPAARKAIQDDIVNNGDFILRGNILSDMAQTRAPAGSATP